MAEANTESPIPIPVPPTGRPVGLLLSRDLIFISKITGTARALDCMVMVAGNAALAETMIGQWKPRVVFVDLAAGDLVATPLLVGLQHVAGLGVPFVAFGSHVDTGALDAARGAGCDPVMPRSKFSAELPELIRHYLLGVATTSRDPG